MKRLSADSFERAASYIREYARPLERSQFDYHFDSGSREQVLAELTKFQNDDGGFGHAVEPDVRMPHSSPFVTSVAFQIISELGVDPSHPLVKSGIDYLERTFNGEIGGWDPTGKAVDEYPHAPWWNYVPFETRLDPLKIANPGAELVGYLRKFGNSSNSSIADEAEEIVLTAFDALPDDMEVHVMMCFMRLAEMGDDRVKTRLLPKLRHGVAKVVGSSPPDWDSYGGKPLWFAGHPQALLADVIESEIQAQLDYEIAKQEPDGSWTPNWSWGQFDEDWERARVEWSGFLTLRNLLAFRAWNRLE